MSDTDETLTPAFDLGPAAQRMTGLVQGVRDDQLGDRTPCPELSVGDLLDHIHRLSQVFRAVAAKQELPGLDEPPGLGSAVDLPSDWRTVLPRRVDELAAAWRSPPAWTGTGQAGGVRMPNEMLAAVALDELVLHGWDLARATGQDFDVDPASEAVVVEFTGQMVGPDAPPPDRSPFGPPLASPEDATPFERALRNAGRDPAWTP